MPNNLNPVPGEVRHVMLHAAINSIFIFVSWLLHVTLCNFNIRMYVATCIATVHIKGNIISAHVSWSSNESCSHEGWLSQLASLQ